MQIPNYLRSRLDSNGVLIADNRFRITDHGTYLTVTFGGASYPFESYDQAMLWMSRQPAPTGSLQLGSTIAKVTDAIGIKKCGACAARQLAFNSIKR